jgi:hypothetical protein
MLRRLARSVVDVEDLTNSRYPSTRLGQTSALLLA